MRNEFVLDSPRFPSIAKGGGGGDGDGDDSLANVVATIASDAAQAATNILRGLGSSNLVTELKHD
jgi:hypothetical protein